MSRHRLYFTKGPGLGPIFGILQVVFRFALFLSVLFHKFDQNLCDSSLRIKNISVVCWGC